MEFIYFYFRYNTKKCKPKLNGMKTYRAKWNSVEESSQKKIQIININRLDFIKPIKNIN
jgi:hypothetical protein